MGFYLKALAIVLSLSVSSIDGQSCQASCKAPSCSCPRYTFPMEAKKIPQMVYFGFDDAVNIVMAGLYNKLFTGHRRNPNGCPIKMTLFVSHQYTDYSLVRSFHRRGMEIAVHSVTHTAIATRSSLLREAKAQKENIHKYAGVPMNEIIGWRSPFLKTAGDVQPSVLKSLGYKYDISLTVSRSSHADPKPWPFTMENGWPYKCGVRPCPTGAKTPGFFEVPVISLMDHKGSYPCAFVDGCSVRATNKNEAYQYLWNNFVAYYNGSRAPFGLNMHAAWFYTPHNLEGMQMFLNKLATLEDVYVLTVKQVLDWIKHPTTLANIHTMSSWSCPEAKLPARAPTRNETIHVPPQRPQRPQRPTTTTSTTTTTTTTTPRPTTTTTTTPRPTTTTTTPRPTTTTTTTPRPTTTTTTTPRPTTTTTTTQRPTTTTTTTTERPTTTTTTTTPRPTTTTTTTTQKPSTTSSTTTAPTRNTAAPIHNVAPVTSGASTLSPFFSSWLGPTRGPPSPPRVPSWWDMSAWSGFLHPAKPSNSVNCNPKTNCRLPDCFCQGQTIPNAMKPKDTPQLVFITIDGSMNPTVYRRYREIFQNKTNPNTCRARGTIFVSELGSFSMFLKAVVSLGAELAMRGVHDHHFANSQQLESEIVAQKNEFKRLGLPSALGWKSPELKAMGDKQYDALSRYNFQYDSTLSVNHRSGENKTWPFTLDFGYKGDCVIPTCPQKKFPGLWEIPNTAVLDYRNKYECSYVDGCMYNPISANHTTNFLWDNFMTNYKSNRAPFGLHLRQVWFSHPVYAKNLIGLQNFVEKVLKLDDVYLVSASDVITWMKQPTKVSDITDTVPWNCRTKV